MYSDVLSNVDIFLMGLSIQNENILGYAIQLQFTSSIYVRCQGVVFFLRRDIPGQKWEELTDAVGIVGSNVSFLHNVAVQSVMYVKYCNCPVYINSVRSNLK